MNTEDKMVPIHDRLGRVVCFCNGNSGCLEGKYQKLLFFAQIPVNGNITFVRDGIATYVERITQTQFYVYNE